MSTPALTSSNYLLSNLKKLEADKINRGIDLTRAKIAKEYKAIFKESDIHSSVKIRNIYKVRVIKEGFNNKNQQQTKVNKDSAIGV